MNLKDVLKLIELAIKHGDPVTAHTLLKLTVKAATNTIKRQGVK